MTSGIVGYLHLRCIQIRLLCVVPICVLCQLACDNIENVAYVTARMPLKCDMLLL